jgi:hypothetical protein
MPQDDPRRDAPSDPTPPTRRGDPVREPPAPSPRSPDIREPPARPPSPPVKDPVKVPPGWSRGK